MKDVLTDILDTIALKAAIYFRTDFHPPFGLSVPAFARTARFHLITQGECYVRLGNGTVVHAAIGDLVFVCNGAPHVLASDADIQCKPLADVLSEAGFTGQGPFTLGAGPAGASCQMVCGHFSFADGADHPLLRAVPEVFHITAAERAQRPMLDDLMRLIVNRMFDDQAGAGASVSRLSEALFIEVIRAGVSQSPDLARLMAAVYDPQIGRALSLIHNDVATAWTVDSLARAVAMSRSRFAERFHDLVGMAPMAYVAEWRLQRAQHLLDLRIGSVKCVATQVGYQSAAAFSRAFADRFGTPPLRYARRHKSG